MSSAGSDVPHHVGRIVDPEVREDGGLEPSVELGVLPETAGPGPEPGPAPGSEPRSEPRPESLPVAADPGDASDDVATVESAAGPLSASGPMDSGAGSNPGAAMVDAAKPPATVGTDRMAPADFEGLVDDDPGYARSRDRALEMVGEGLLARRRSLPPEPKSPMSPQLIALFGALLGVVTVATIIAIAMRIDNQKPLVEPIASSKSSAGPIVASTAEKPPEPKRRQRERVSGPYRIKDSASDSSLRLVEGQIGFDPFLKAVEKAGVPLKEAYRLLVAFEKVRPLNSCSRHDKFVAALDRASKRIKAFEYITGPEEVFQAKEGEGGLLIAEKLDLKVKRERVTGSFLVGSAGLERSVTEGAFEPQLLRSMREALIGHLSLEEIERGSRVRVIAQEVTALGEFARYAGIEALEIVFVSEKKRLRIYFFNGPKSRGYFDETARAPYEGGWRSPIPNAPVTSKFNMHRMHPVLHKIMPHTGVDFGAAMGVPIGASSFGTVTFVGWGGPTGNFVRLEHSGGVETGYAHMSRFAEGLKVGDKVKRLQTIGYVGSTGRSTGPHLHFTVKRDGKFIDPLTLNLDALRVLPSDEREVFLQQKAQYDLQLDAIELPPPLKSDLPAAPTTEPASEGFEEEGVEGGEGAATATAGSAPAAPAESAAPAAAPAAKSSLYLTDEELLRMQKSSDSGEVEE